MNIFETKRIFLREFTPEGAPERYRIYKDPINMKFMGRQPDSIEFDRYHICKHIADYYDKRGFGLWAVVLKENNQLIGHCGFVYQSVEGAHEIEVPYLLDKHYLGRGLATEAVNQTVRLGFEKYNFPHIIALINPNNVASVRVAEKIGMKYQRDERYKNFDKVAMYVVTESDLSKINISGIIL